MITEQEKLSAHTTLQVGGPADFFSVFETEAELESVIAYAIENDLSVRVLGGGSNVLIPDEGMSGLIIKNSLLGMVPTVDGDSVRLTASAGESFDDVVLHCVTQGWWGLENLSHIPGSVGATPIQNVGAYGVEVKDVVESVRVFDIAAKEFKTLTNEDCKFGYRDSVFKSEAGKSYVVTAVTFRLSTHPKPLLAYKDLVKFFEENKQPSLSEIREAVIEIRSKKFPDWKQVGTAGSFFKNPIVSADKFKKLREEYPEMPGYEMPSDTIKIPLGWILDKVLQVKGVREGNVGTYEGQALVLINHGGASSAEISAFAQNIINEVQERLDIVVEWEVTRW